MRSMTIDAENEEEFNKEFDRTHKITRSRLNYALEEDEKFSETIEDEYLANHKDSRRASVLQEEIDGGDYEGLGAFNDDEDELGADTEENDKILGAECEMIKNNENPEEKGIELLCLYLKNSVTNRSKISNKNKENEKIFYRSKNPLRVLSGNAIHDLNFRELVDNIMNENGNEGLNDNDINDNDNLGVNNEGQNTLKEFICQNIESDATLKIMVMSNNKSTKNLFVQKLLDIKQNQGCEKCKEDDEPFEIRKKQIILFNKYVTLQIFDTSDKFHDNKISSIYYKSANAFFFFIEATNHNSKNYIDKIYEKIEKYAVNKSVVIFGINLLFKEDSTIDDVNLRDYANDKGMMFIPMKLDEFNLKNNLIINLLNLILIKRIDNKTSKECLRKESKNKRLGGMKKKLTNKITDSCQLKRHTYEINKMKIPSTLGYKKKYRIRHINAFDMNDDNTVKPRKWSADL